uniref:Uncharacterized protein n=1 Tax=Globodera rostochiensis TaxID=31243 RepID=A0A914HE91_GLORO
MTETAQSVLAGWQQAAARHARRRPRGRPRGKIFLMPEASQRECCFKFARFVLHFSTRFSAAETVLGGAEMLSSLIAGLQQPFTLIFLFFTAVLVGLIAVCYCRQRNDQSSYELNITERRPPPSKASEREFFV